MEFIKGFFQRMKENKVMAAAFVFAMIMLLCGIYLIIQVERYVPLKYTLFVGVLILLIIVLGFLLVYKGGKAGLVYTLILALLFGVGSCGAQRIGGFTDKILDNSETEVIQIIALKKSKIKASDDFKNYKIGYVKSDTNGTSFAKEVLKDEGKSNVKSKTYDTYKEVYEALENKKIDMMPITSYAQGKLQEESISYEKKTKVLFEKKREMKSVASGNKDINKDPFVVFISGVDLTSSDINATGSSDVNILLAVNPKTKRVLMQSIPRDLWAEIPCAGNKHTKLTYAGAIGGANCSIEAIQQYFDVNIDYYAKINFQGVQDLVDALGGITVYSDTSYCGGEFCYKEGLNDVNGEEALMFSRLRKMLAKGDVGRGIHQMEVVRGVVNKFLETPSMDHLNSLLGAVENNFTANLESKDLSKALQLLISLKDTIGNMESYSIEGDFEWTTDETSGEYLYYYFPKEGQTELVKDRIQDLLDGKQLDPSMK